MKWMKPTLSHLAYLTEAGAAIREMPLREREIIRRAEKAIADAERDLMALRSEARTKVRSQWSSAEEDEARAFMKAEIAAGR